MLGTMKESDGDRVEGLNVWVQAPLDCSWSMGTLREF